MDIIAYLFYIINNNMIRKVLFFLLLPLTLQKSISASLMITQYEPLHFYLSFSEAVSFPSFQLILNNVHLLNYTLLTSQTPAQTFAFQADNYPLPDSQVLEKFQVLFNQPFSIGSGRLPVDYFRLIAQKDGMQIQEPEVWGFLVIIAGYLLINFGFFGMILIEFLQVYCLLNFRTNTHTYIYHTVSKALFMINPNTSETSNQLVMAQLCLPPLAIIFLGFVGLMVKKYVKDRKSIVKRVTYEIFVYDSLVCAGLTFILPSFYNSLQFFKQSSLGIYGNDASLTKMGMLFSYIGVITPPALIYLFIYQINPKCQEGQQSWKKYIQGEQFQSFRRLHSILKKEKWYTRNKIVFMTVKLLIIASLSFLPVGFEICVFVLEFMNLFLAFMIQPYKEEIYLNIVGACRLFMLSYYGVRVMGSLYYSLSPAMVNYSTVKPYLIGCDVLFLIVCFCLIIAISYEIYIKFSQLNYQIKLVREKNEIRLKFVQRRPTEAVSQKDRRIEKMDLEMSQAYEQRSKKGSLSPDGRKRDSSALRRPTRINEFNLPKKKHSIMIEEQGLELSFPNKDQELLQSKLRGNSKTVVSIEEQEAKNRKDKIKWKKQSLLASILKEQ